MTASSSPASMTVLLIIAPLIVALFIALPICSAKYPSFFSRFRFYSTHSLTLFATVAFIPMFALVEMAGRYGIAALAAMIVFSLLDMLSPVVLKPIQWFTNRHKISGITDILVYRFRGRLTGVVITAVLLITTIPLATAMLQGAVGTISILLGQQPSTAIELAIAAAILAIASFSGYAIYVQQGRRSSHELSLHLAALAILGGALLGLLLIVPDVFGGFREMNQWAQQRQQFQTSLRLTNLSALVAMFFAASIVLPQFYNIRSFARSETAVSQTSWLFPLLLLLASLPMLPMLWSGIATRADIPLQFYLPSLGTTLNLPLASFVTSLAALTACIAGLGSLICSLIQPATNYLATPTDLNFSTRGIYAWLRKTHLIVLPTIGVLWLASLLLIQTHSITDLLLVAFSGLTQLTPAVLATFYFPGVTRRGILWGICGGTLLWFFGLFLPLFTDNLMITIPGIGVHLHLGLPYWSSLFYEALFLNIGLTLLVSLPTKMTREERIFAQDCMVDNLPENYRMNLKQGSIDDFRQGLRQSLGEQAANDIVNRLLKELGLNETESRPFQLRQFRQGIAASLNYLVGTNTSYQLVNKYFPALSQHRIDNNYASLKGVFDVSAPQLSGLTAELNRFRVNHQNTLKGLPIGVCLLDQAGEISSWNTAMEQHTGITESSAQGALIKQLPTPWGDIFTTFIASNKASEHAIETTINGESRWCTLHQSTIEHEQPAEQSHQILLLEDVTEIVQLSRGLIHSERLASVGRLAAGVAHEIGNPVTGIACLAQDIQAAPNAHSVKDDARMIVDQTHRITRIVRSLTDFSRSHQQRHETETFDVNIAIDDAIALLALSNDKQISFSKQGSDPVFINGDQHQVTQVFLNLFANAYDVSNTGDTISTRIEQTTDLVQIRVMDQGPGIPKEKREAIFEPFFTTKDVGEGTGLGLSIVYDIISLHQGTIAVEEHPEGNCFLIQLPLPTKQNY